MRTRLEWMIDNRPEYLLELYNAGHLKQHLRDRIAEAEELEAQLEQQDLNEIEVMEFVLEMIAPPPTGDEPERDNPIQEAKREEIREAMFGNVQVITSEADQNT